MGVASNPRIINSMMGGKIKKWTLKVMPSKTSCVLQEVLNVHKTGKDPQFSKKVLNFTKYAVT